MGLSVIRENAGPSNGGLNWQSTSLRFGQVFSPSEDYKVNSIQIAASGNGAPVADGMVLTFGIWDDGANEPAYVMHEDVSVVEGDNVAGEAGVKWYVFNLGDTEPKIVTSLPYFFSIRLSNASQQVGLTQANGNYAGGNKISWTDANGFWVLDSAEDLMFRTFGENLGGGLSIQPAPAIAYPSTVDLSALRSAVDDVEAAVQAQANTQLTIIQTLESQGLVEEN